MDRFSVDLEWQEKECSYFRARTNIHTECSTFVVVVVDVFVICIRYEKEAGWFLLLQSKLIGAPGRCAFPTDLSTDTSLWSSSEDVLASQGK